MEQATGITAVLFDKDGTLIDVNATSAIHTERVIATLGKGDPDREADLRTALGYDAEAGRLMDGSVVIAGSSQDITAAIVAVRSELSEEEIDRAARQAIIGLPVQTLAHVESTLQDLKAQGYRLGVATNDYEEAARIQIAGIGIDHFFEFVCGADSGYGSKPNPGMVHAFCQHTGCDPAQVAIIGDSLHDVHLGQHAGCGQIVGVTTGYASAETLAEHGATVIASLGELIGALHPRAS